LSTEKDFMKRVTGGSKEEEERRGWRMQDRQDGMIRMNGGWDGWMIG